MRNGDARLEQKMIPNVKEIVKAYLIANKFDGLFSDGVCSCEVGDLEPCGQMQSDCQAGYKQKCDCSNNCKWHIGEKKHD
jgi:hypothetical protein